MYRCTPMDYIRDFRDCILNRLAVWCMKHCHNWSIIFYTACRQLSSKQIEIYAKQVIAKKKEEEAKWSD